MIKALLFDLDETLLDRNASIQAFLAGQYARFAEQMRHVPFPHYRERFLVYDDNGYVAKEIVYARLVNELKLTLDAAQLVEDFYTNSWQPAILFAGVLDLLQAARTAGYKLGIITNGSVRTQQAKLAHSGLLPLMDVALISEAEGVRKPDATIFLRATQQLGVKPSACIMVGDNPQADIDGARQLGMKTIWRQGYLPWPADLTTHPQRTVAAISDLLGFDWQQL